MPRTFGSVEGTLAASARPAAPWHLWAVGLLGLVWNLFQCLDYVMSQRRDAQWLAHVPPEMPAYLDSFPWWSTAQWAIGVWGALLGSVCLLVRVRHASVAFLVAWVATALTYGYHYIDGMPASLNTPAINSLKALLFFVIVLQWWYARTMRDRGVLG